MFTGIVEGIGVVRRWERRGRNASLQIRPSFRSGRLKLGESIAVNGCCLTVSRRGDGWFGTDLSGETLRATNLKGVREGDSVNLEKAARLGDRIGGHLVSGHVDGVGIISSVRHKGRDLVIEISVPSSLRRYLIPKGSVAVDGISMTVNRLRRDRFSLVVIPHTLKRTTLGSRRAGDPVNLEVDMVGKYIVSFVRPERRKGEIKG